MEDSVQKVSDFVTCSSYFEHSPISFVSSLFILLWFYIVFTSYLVV